MVKQFSREIAITAGVLNGLILKGSMIGIASALFQRVEVPKLTSLSFDIACVFNSKCKRSPVKLNSKSI